MIGPSERDRAIAPEECERFTPLYKVRAFNRVHRWDEQHKCPACFQDYLVYRRNINSAGARLLIEMANVTDEVLATPRGDALPPWVKRGRTLVRRTERIVPPPWIHVPSLITNRLPDVSHDYLTFFWGLMVEERVLRPDGGHAGWWRITGLGMDFVDDEEKVQKYVYLCDNRVLQFADPLVTIYDALGTKFDLRDIRRRGD